MFAFKSEEMEAWREGGISPSSPLLGANSCPFAFPVLPAKAVPLNMKVLSCLQEGCQAHSWALSLWSEKAVPASSTRCYWEGSAGEIWIPHPGCPRGWWHVGGSCLTRFKTQIEFPIKVIFGLGGKAGLSLSQGLW